MVDVFKTNVECPEKARMLVSILVKHYPNSRINFDLDDCDKILRVQYQGAAIPEIAPLLNEHGFLCEALPD
ncbi:MAG TPA: hypothetical protein VK543_11545 [Puia sp.]|nr:hypothetical protein [Puia sp.]